MHKFSFNRRNIFMHRCVQKNSIYFFTSYSSCARLIISLSANINYNFYRVYLPFYSITLFHTRLKRTYPKRIFQYYSFPASFNKPSFDKYTDSGRLSASETFSLALVINKTCQNYKLTLTKRFIAK